MKFFLILIVLSYFSAWAGPLPLQKKVSFAELAENSDLESQSENKRQIEKIQISAKKPPKKQYLDLPKKHEFSKISHMIAHEDNKFNKYEQELYEKILENKKRKKESEQQMIEKKLQVNNKIAELKMKAADKAKEKKDESDLSEKIREIESDQVKKIAEIERFFAEEQKNYKERYRQKIEKFICKYQNLLESYTIHLLMAKSYLEQFTPEMSEEELCENGEQKLVTSADIEARLDHNKMIYQTLERILAKKEAAHQKE